MPRKGPAPQPPAGRGPGLQLAAGHPADQQDPASSGKRQLAERIVYGALEGCREKSGTDPVVTLKRAMDNVKPTLEVRSRRVGGATYQVPVEVRPPRADHAGPALAGARTPRPAARRP